MNLAHVHLLLNHFPTIGFGIGLFFLMALVTIAVYISGSAAQNLLHNRPDVAPGLVRAHEDAAFWALVFMELTGFIAWLGLWQFHLIKRLATWNTVTVLVLSILTFAVTARTANLGGDIRHPEILSEQQSATDDGAGVPDVARSVADFVTGHAWAWPTLETLHFVGLLRLEFQLQRKTACLSSRQSRGAVAVSRVEQSGGAPRPGAKAVPGRHTEPRR